MGSFATFPHQFTGRDQNTATGLQYNRARYYAYGHGRFVSEDPIGLAGGSANPYLYASGAPTVFRDPLGLMGEACLDAGSYIDLNLTANVWRVLGVTTGVIRDCETKALHFYLGAGFTGKGVSGAVSYAPTGGVATEWNCAISFTGVGPFRLGAWSAGIGGGEFFGEVGFGAPFGGSATCYYVF